MHAVALCWSCCSQNQKVLGCGASGDWGNEGELCPASVGTAADHAREELEPPRGKEGERPALMFAPGAHTFLRGHPVSLPWQGMGMG